jgi:hypothetical protein
MRPGYALSSSCILITFLFITSLPLQPAQAQSSGIVTGRVTETERRFQNIERRTLADIETGRTVTIGVAANF